VPIDTMELVDHDAAPERALERMDVSRRVADAIAALPVRQREALLLCHFEGQSNAEAARVLEVSVDALESLLARARQNLRAVLGHE
jgi:RNA polymerase sigma-70 factor (ECF subfamily)